MGDLTAAIKQTKKSFTNLYTRARLYGFWFKYKYGDKWLHPNDLEALQTSGENLWGIHQWELRDPKERIEKLEKIIATNKAEIDYIKSKIKV